MATWFTLLVFVFLVGNKAETENQRKSVTSSPKKSKLRSPIDEDEEEQKVVNVRDILKTKCNYLIHMVIVTSKFFWCLCFIIQKFEKDLFILLVILTFLNSEGFSFEGFSNEISHLFPQRNFQKLKTKDSSKVF